MALHQKNMQVGRNKVDSHYKYAIRNDKVTWNELNTDSKFSIKTSTLPKGISVSSHRTEKEDKFISLIQNGTETEK
jgi:hypothetical protein